MTSRWSGVTRGFPWLVGGLLGALSALAVPAGIGIQGRLLGQEGQPVGGVLSVQFGLFEAAEGGTPTWAETYEVAFHEGFYAIELGSTGTPLPATLPADLWLQLTIAGEDLTPRLHLASSPYARRAAWADRLTGTTAAMGEGSGLDADRIDGLDSEDLASAEDLAALTTDLAAHTHTGAALVSALTALGGSLPFVTVDDYASQDTENLADNGGFERFGPADGHGHRVPAGWSTTPTTPQDPGSVGTRAIDASTDGAASVQGGSMAVALVDESIRDRSCLRQAVFATLPGGMVGTPLALTLWARKTDTFGAVTGEVAFVGGEGIRVATPLPSATAWTRVTLHWIIPQGATLLAVEVCPTDAAALSVASYAVDSLMLTRGRYEPQYRDSIADRIASATGDPVFDDLVVNDTLGVGTAQPLAPLHVTGNARVGGSLTVTGAAILDGGVAISGGGLSAAGTVHSTTGGFKFPDGTVQTTASTGGGSSNAGIQTTRIALVVQTNTAAPGTRVDITSAKLGVGPNVLTNVTLTADIATVGANGRDASTAPANATWWSVWVITNAAGTQVASLLSAADGVASQPTLPSGYLHARRVSWVRRHSDGSFRKFMQSAQTYQYYDNAYERFTYSATNVPHSDSFITVDAAGQVPPGIRFAWMGWAFWVTGGCSEGLTPRPIGSDYPSSFAYEYAHALGLVAGPLAANNQTGLRGQAQMALTADRKFEFRFGPGSSTNGVRWIVLGFRDEDL